MRFTPDILELCRELGALYIDTVAEPWTGFYFDKDLSQADRTNYALRENILAARRAAPGGPTAVDLHQYCGLLGLGFALFHALVLLGDRYVGYTPPQLLVPFASLPYRPLAVGLGQIALYLGLLVGLSFYVRQHIGFRAWRLAGLIFARTVRDEVHHIKAAHFMFAKQISRLRLLLAENGDQHIRTGDFAATG